MTPDQKAKKSAYMKRYRAMKKAIETPERRAQKAEYMRRYRLTENGRAALLRYQTSTKRKVVERRKELLRTYGITPEEYDTILAAQAGGCAICGKSPDIRRLAVDHDHSNGMVRGLLCAKHNMAVGIVESDELATIFAYVEKWKALHRDLKE